MPMLDRARPYGEVWGATGCAGFVQDGREYGLDGQPRGAEPAVAQPPPAKGKPKAKPVLAAPARALTDAEKQRWESLRARRYFSLSGQERREYQTLKAMAARDEPNTPAETMQPPDDELKAMVEIAGGTWTDRAAAQAFLSEDH